MKDIDENLTIKQILSEHSLTWGITGVAGFIGSNILEHLLNNGQKVIGLDNFITGKAANLSDVRQIVGNTNWKNFTMIEGDIRSYETCIRFSKNCDILLHQAAIGSVQRSFDEPELTTEVNISGYLNILRAAVEHKIKKVVYASSSAVYGDHPDLPKVEVNIGNCLSVYAISKLNNELYSRIFNSHYEIDAVGLRYFNVFGQRQDENSDYSAVIPKWIAQMLVSKDVTIFGDGSTSRDFCFIDNVVQANILAGISSSKNQHKVFNIAAGARTNLIDLFEMIKLELINNKIIFQKTLNFKDFRKGDVLHSHANIELAKINLNYKPSHSVEDGIIKTVQWYIGKYDKKGS